MAAQQLFHATPRPLTRDEYDRIAQLGLFLGERVELIHGIVVRMSPIGPPHSEVVDRLTEVLLRGVARRARVRIQQPFLAWDESEPEPDVAVVPSGSYAARHPDGALLIIEVADTPLDYDRETKGPLYAASSVPEYWIVDLAQRRIEVRTDPRGGRYEQVRMASLGDTCAPGAFTDVEVSVSDLFASST
jgi:Uma2 family endonuclease